MWQEDGSLAFKADNGKKPLQPAKLFYRSSYIISTPEISHLVRHHCCASLSFTFRYSLSISIYYRLCCIDSQNFRGFRLVIDHIGQQLRYFLPIALPIYGNVFIGQYLGIKKSGHLYANCDKVEDNSRFFFYLINRYENKSGIYIMQNTMVRGRGNGQLGKKIKIRSQGEKK